MHSLTAVANSPQAQFVDAFDSASEKMIYRMNLGPLVFLHLSRKFRRACHTVHNFVDNTIASVLSEKRNAALQIGEKAQNGTRYNFLEELSDSVKNREKLRSELLNILLAGRDTTAALLSHAFWALARSPDVWAKLDAEVSDLQGQAPDYEQLKNMTYLRHVLHESEFSCKSRQCKVFQLTDPALRLWPVVPLNSREAVRDTILPTGGGKDHKSPIFIPKGQKYVEVFLVSVIHSF